MDKTCGTCIYMAAEDGEPFCVLRYLYYSVTPGTLACDDWRGDNAKQNTDFGSNPASYGSDGRI